MEQPQHTPPASLATFRPAWPLFVCMMVCAAICQCRMIAAFLEQRKLAGTLVPHQDLEADFLLGTLVMCLEVAAFMAIIRPWTFDLILTQRRSTAFTLFTFGAGYYHMGQNALEPNEVTDALLPWGAMLVLGGLSLFFACVVASLVRQWGSRR
ncbi:MAG: hypothetical protein U0176_03675 [Bacteroidia bacterium]